MSLWVVYRSVKDGNRELYMNTSCGKYCIKYKSGNQRTDFKNNITDEGYANYLFDMYLNDMNMNEDRIDLKKEIHCIDVKINSLEKYLRKDYLRYKMNGLEKEKQKIKSCMLQLVKQQHRINELIEKYKI